MKGCCHTNSILQEYRRGYLFTQVMCYILMTPPGQKVGFKTDVTWTVFAVQRGNKYLVAHIFLTHTSFGFAFSLKIKTPFGNFQNPFLAHNRSNSTSDMKTRWQIGKMKPFRLR